MATYIVESIQNASIAQRTSTSISISLNENSINKLITTSGIDGLNYYFFVADTEVIQIEDAAWSDVLYGIPISIERFGWADVVRDSIE